MNIAWGERERERERAKKQNKIKSNLRSQVGMLLSGCRTYRRTHLQHLRRCGCLDSASVLISVHPVSRWSHAIRAQRRTVCMAPFEYDSVPNAIRCSTLCHLRARNVQLRHGTVTDVPSIRMTWKWAMRLLVAMMVVIVDRDSLAMTKMQTMMNHLLQKRRKQKINRRENNELNRSHYHIYAKRNAVDAHFISNGLGRLHENNSRKATNRMDRVRSY